MNIKVTRHTPHTIGSFLLLTLCLITISILISGCSKPIIDEEEYDTTPVLSIGGRDVSYAEYRHYYLNDKFDIDGGDSNVWKDNDSLTTKLKETVLTDLKNNYVTWELAARHGVELNEEDKEAIEQEIEDTSINLGSDETMKLFLSTRYITDRLYVKFTELTHVGNELFEKLCGEGGEYHPDADDTLFDYVKSDYFRTLHIFVPVADDSDGEKELVTVSEAYKEVIEGADFYDTMLKYGEDTVMEGMPEGVYFTYGEMDFDYSSAVYKLKPGEISEPVLAENGYYVIKRLEPDTAYIKDNPDQFKQSYAENIFYDEFDELFESIEVVYYDIYSQINMDNIR